jgi:Ca2+-binding RTX toxin-like protein
MRTASSLALTLAVTIAAALIGYGATAAKASAPEPLSVKLVDGVVQVNDTGYDSGSVFVLSNYEIILESDRGGYDIGPGCQKGPGRVVHPGYDHDDEYVVCPGWNHLLIRGEMGAGRDFVDQRSAPATLQSVFDLGSDPDRYIGGPGVDIVHGGADSDELAGAGGDDQLFGDGDDDTIDPGPGNDVVSGGESANVGDDDDLLRYRDAVTAITAKLTPDGTVVQGPDTDVVSGIEGLVDSKGNDKITVQGTAGSLFSVTTEKGYDQIWSRGFASITSDNAERDQIRAHQRTGARARAGYDEITCLVRRPSRLEVDRGVDKITAC